MTSEAVMVKIGFNLTEIIMLHSIYSSTFVVKCYFLYGIPNSWPFKSAVAAQYVCL